MSKNLAPELQEHLNGRATKMAYCWKVTRNDGIVQGFTDHDNSLTFDGVSYEAATGFTASQFSASLGLSVDNFEIEGALSSDSINEQDLVSGHYDNASVEVYWVNWSDLSQRHLVSKGYIGEVKRHGALFSAEMRGLSNILQQKIGRKYQRYCSAIVGDEKCGLDLTSEVYRGSGTVDIVRNNRVFTVSGLSGFENDWFTTGMINWTSGSNQNLGMEIKLHSHDTSVTEIELWQPMPTALEVGDSFFATVGCKQDANTCNLKFDNIANFRGFNLIPGPDMLLFYPKVGSDNLDGGSLFGN